MRIPASAIVTVAALAISSTAAFTQNVMIAPEQETVIREYVKKEPAVSLKLPGFEFNIGSTVPDAVELREIPDAQYRYVVVDGRTVVVQPETRRIVKVLD